jgi:hypothetical protein
MLVMLASGLGSMSRAARWSTPDDLGGGDCGAAAGSAAGAGGFEAFAGAGDDEFADELGEGGEDVEDQPSAGCGGVQVLVQEVKPTPWRPSPPTVVIRSCREGDSRSSDGTTRVSPGAMKARQAVSSGRLVSRPDCFSAKMRRQPAAVSASVCRSRFCPPVETRALALLSCRVAPRAER